MKKSDFDAFILIVVAFYFFFLPKNTLPSMFLFKTVSDLQSFLTEQKALGKSIGFTPTMGALHKGHLSLVENAKTENDLSVCSIFVNPTQFDKQNDLTYYPRPIEKDMELLISVNNDVLFLPSVEEVYPEDLETPDFDLKGLDVTMEGTHRKGHFAGVVQVVHRFLTIVEPDKLYMGQKDFQQFSVIRQMLKEMDSQIKIVRCPIVREPDGLAMSSRNVRLNELDRRRALAINQALFHAKSKVGDKGLLQIKKEAIEELTLPGLSIDYFEIVDAITLQPVQSFNESDEVVAITTVRVGGVRLLDNMYLKE